jgi:hypothetical protein
MNLELLTFVVLVLTLGLTAVLVCLGRRGNRTLDDIAATLRRLIMP